VRELLDYAKTLDVKESCLRELNLPIALCGPNYLGAGEDVLPTPT